MGAAQQLWNIAAALGWYLFLNARLEHTNDKRSQNVGVAFVVAGLVSIGLTLLFYEAYPRGLLVAASRWNITYDIAVVGIVEEGAKFLAFLFAVKAAAGIKEPQDGAIFGAVVGITFGTVENIFYIQEFDSFVMWIRPVATTGGHGIYGAIWGALYSHAVYANVLGDDPGAKHNAAIGVPIVALVHGLYNAATVLLPLAFFVNAIGLVIALLLYRSLVELSPYRIYPLSMAKIAVASIRRGLAFNPRSPLLNRNLGIYLMHLGKYRSAAEHLRASVPRSRDPRRAQFLAACCESTFLPGVYRRRGLRIAWARLSDDQRRKCLRQLEELVADRDGIVAHVREFVESAFTPRRMKSTREIAREAKVRRLERRQRRTGQTAARAIASLSGEERERMARRVRGGEVATRAGRGGAPSGSATGISPQPSNLLL